MRPVRRLFVSIGAPLILMLGVGVAWGVRKGSTVVREIERWSESLEHTADPVELRVSGFPIISTMYLDGAKIGKLDRIVMLRERVGDVDSVQVIAHVDDRHLARVSQCNFAFNPEAMQDVFPTEGWKRVLQCESDVSHLTPFGTVLFEGSDLSAPLYVERSSADCSDELSTIIETSVNAAMASVVEVSEALGSDVHATVDEVVIAPTNVTLAVDCLRSQKERVRAQVTRLRDEIRRDVRRSLRRRSP